MKISNFELNLEKVKKMRRISKTGGDSVGHMELTDFKLVLDSYSWFRIQIGSFRIRNWKI